MKYSLLRLVQTPRDYYMYDCSRDSITTISKGLYSMLSKEKDLDFADESIRLEITQLKQRGYLSGRHVKRIEHPGLKTLTYQLDHNIEQLLLQVTQQCNLTCYYCPYANVSSEHLQRDHSNLTMTWETAKKSIDFYMAHSDEQGEAHVSFYGGEPFVLYPLVKQAMEYCGEVFRGKKIIYSITTNGTLLNDEMIHFMAMNDVHLTFSIDGPASIHDVNRKTMDGNGSFCTAVKNLKKAYSAYGERAKDSLSINMVINPESDLFEVMKLFDDPFFGHELRMIQAGIAEDDMLDKKFVSSDSYDLVMEYQFFLGYLSFMGIVKDLDIPYFAKSYFRDFEMNNSLYYSKNFTIPEAASPSGPCIPGKRRLFVSANGTFYPCERVNELSNVLKIGHVDRGFDYEKAANVLNFHEFSSEDCLNCFAFWHCKLCARSAGGPDAFSLKMKRPQCRDTRQIVEGEIRNCILLKEVRTIYRRWHESEANPDLSLLD